MRTSSMPTEPRTLRPSSVVLALLATAGLSFAVAALALAAQQRVDARAADDSEAQEAERVEYLPSPSPTEDKILRSLDKPTTVDFTETPLEDTLGFLKDFHDINVWIDRAQLAEDGMALDTPVTLKLAGVRLESVLNLLLRPLQLDFVIEDDVMKITTRTHAYETMFTRTYPVRDLYPNGKIEKTRGSNTGEKEKKEKDDKAKAPAEPETIGDLERAIKETVEPKSWDEKAKSPGSIAYVSESGSLVIRQSWPVHQKVLKLLRDLRQAKKLKYPAPREKKTAATEAK